MIVVWDDDQGEPWVVMTDLPPDEAGVCWYGLRFWIGGYAKVSRGTPLHLTKMPLTGLCYHTGL